MSLLDLLTAQGLELKPAETACTSAERTSRIAGRFFRAARAVASSSLIAADALPRHFHLY